MKIYDHFQKLNLTKDQRSALEKIYLFLDSDDSVFILQGFAGSGKTTLIKGLVDYLEAQDEQYKLMAPTGRAAKVLREKTLTEATTIHSGIYDFENLQSINADAESPEDHSFHYFFPIAENDLKKSVIIVDESSMISNKESKNELFTFGTNVLLSDLLTYARTSVSKNKIIFVGDPAQLPPVGDSRSEALNPSFFESMEIPYQFFVLTEVVRQSDNLVLKNSTRIRELIFSEKRSELKFDYDVKTFIKNATEDFIQTFCDHYDMNTVGNSVMIAYSNAQCYHNNESIREKIFPGNDELVVGDVLLINNNNYHSYGTSIFNGDLCRVIEVADDTVTQTAPVYTDINGKKERVNFTLTFKKVKIRLPQYQEDIECYIHYDLLKSIERNLDIDELKALYINFVMRWTEQQKEARESGKVYYSVGSEEFKKALKKDPFVNALRVKYGYSITCHKAQGGEWETCFVDYTGRVGLNVDALKWSYTATTRAKSKIYCLNPPHFGKFGKLEFKEIGQIGTYPKYPLSFIGVKTSPYHIDTDHKCKSLKYWDIVERIQGSQFEIVSVNSPEGGYLERYVVKDEKENEFQLDGNHNGAGVFTKPFIVSGATKVSKEVMQELDYIFNAPTERSLVIDWSPKEDFLLDLHSIIQNACIATNISITNIVRTGSYDVTYYFMDGQNLSYIQFYFDSNGKFSSALPKISGSNFEGLNSLIEKIKSHAYL